MQVISIIPELGSGGLTNASLLRTHVLGEAGFSPFVMVYSDMGDIEHLREELIADGRVHPNTQILNPYHYYRNKYGRQSRRLQTLKLTTPKNTIKKKRLDYSYKSVIREKDLDNEFLFDSDGQIIAIRKRAVKDNHVREVEIYNSAGVVEFVEMYGKNGERLSVRTMLGDTKVSERYFSTSGFCFLHKEYSSLTGKMKRLWFWSPSDEEPKQYDSIWEWRRDFVKNILEQSEEPGVLLCDGNNTPAQFYSLASAKTKVVAMIHMNHRLEDEKLRPVYATYFNKLHKFDATICLTERQKNDIQNITNDSVHIVTIPNYIPSADQDLIEQTDNSPSNLNANEVVMISRLVKGKGLSDVVRAFAQVVEKLPSAHLSIYGEGSERAALLTEIKRHHMENAITLRGKTQEALKCMNRAAVTLFASHSEGFGLTIAESLSVGTPVVAFACDYGPDELIVDGKTGYIIPDRNVSEFAEAIVDVLEDSTLRNAMGQQAKEWFDTNLSGPSLSYKWKTFIQSLYN